MRTHDDLIAFLERLLAAVDLVDKADYGAAKFALPAIELDVRLAKECAMSLTLNKRVNASAWSGLAASARRCIHKRKSDPQMHLAWFKVMEALARLVSLDLARLRKIAAEAAGQANKSSSSEAVGH